MRENRKTLPQMIRFTARNSPNRLTRRLGRFLPRCNSDALSINASPEFQYNAPKLKQLEDNAGRHFRIPLAWATMRFPSPTQTKTLKKTRAKVLPNDALKILDVITSKGSPTAKGTQTHLRLIQDFLHPAIHQQPLNGFAFSPSKTKRLSNELDQILDLTSMNHRQHFEGSRIDASILSNAVSSFGCERNLHGGAPCHCVALKTGFIFNVYVGSSLITMYGKCGESESAYKVFEEMPVRNVVSWTAIIAGFSQEFHVDVCLQLFQQMKTTTLKPNEYTFTSVLIACSGSGALLQGRNTHCQIIQMGFESHIHISNTLISMYCKSGAFSDAIRVFENLSDKDIVSWNSMIAGYAQHGLSAEAVCLFEKMKDQSVNPDAITFLAILSSCRHEGLVSKGQYYFNLMAKHGLDPELDHYSCVVDLLGRAGMLEEAKNFIEKMPISPNSVIWGSLLSSCRLHGNVRIGIEAAENRLLIEPECAATHVQLVNLYARAGRQGHAAKLRTLMKDRGMKMSPGYSWIEIQNKVHRFGAEDMSNDKIVDILVFVDSMVDHMNSIGSWEAAEFDD